MNCKAWIAKNSFADSVAFDSESGKIFFVGNFNEAKQSAIKYDEVVDLGKKLVLPAFTDGHCHFVEGAYVNSQLNLREAATKIDFETEIKKFRQNNRNKWIQGGFFSESNFTEKFLPDKQFLDEICNDIPVVISRFDTHSAFANSKAIELSGILNCDANFPSEELIRDSRNELTGELKERARHFVLEAIPPPAMNERREAAVNLMREFHACGITSISDITLPDDLEVYADMIANDVLQLNVDARLPFKEYLNIKKYSKEFFQSDVIKFKSLKAFYDGSLSSKTALMSENYKDTGYDGMKTDFVQSGDFEKMFFEIDNAGLQMSVHAIGDKAVSDLLDMNEILIQRHGKKDRRFRIEHAQHIQSEDFRRFKELSIIASVQPSHLFSDAKTAYEILTDFELEHNYSQLFDVGSRVCFGTDFPVVSENPFETIYYAMTRKVAGFESGFVIRNRISLENCLKAYTIENAFASFRENDLGSIATGKFADLIVLEDNLFEMKPDEIRNAKISKTFFKGKPVYEKIA